MNALAPTYVGNADDGALRHARMGGERAFNLDGKDVLAAADDHVLQPVHDIDVALLVHPAEIAGMHPSTPDPPGGLFGQTPISRNHNPAPDNTFAVLAERKFCTLRQPK